MLIEFRGKRLLDSDLLELGERVKHINVVSFGQGYVYKTRARGCSPAETEYWGKLAIAKFQDALNQDFNDM
jgi:hypothetical protein